MPRTLDNRGAAVTVRALQADEVEEAIALLRREFVPNLAPGTLRQLFDYGWMADKPSLGFGLWIEGRLVGFLGAVYADRVIDSVPVKTCNFSTWYVGAEFRHASLKLVRAATSQKGCACTNFTGATVSQIMKVLGFTAVDDHKLVYPAWRFVRPLFRPGVAVESDPAKIADTISPEDRRVLEDHAPYDVRHYRVDDGGEYAYAVFKRRSVPGTVLFPNAPIGRIRSRYYGSMEMLGVSNPALLRRLWPSFAAAVLRREKAWSLVAGPRLFRGEVPAGGVEMPYPTFVRPDAGDAPNVDYLYSELVLLPI